MPIINMYEPLQKINMIYKYTLKLNECDYFCYVTLSNVLKICKIF